METVNLTSKKNTFKLPYCGTQLTLSGDFDSGNLNWAGVDSQKQEIQLLFGKDKDVKPSNKCWFYFSIQGYYNYLPVKLLLTKVNSLSTVAKIYDLYRPVVRVEGGDWQRHEYPVEFQLNAENDINFRMTIDLHDSKKVQIALCYPWSVTDNQNYLNALSKELQYRKDIYFNKEVLVNSVQKRPVHLIAISSGQVNSHPPQQYVESLFPNRQTETHFKAVKKPLVLITARVHPGEIGSSYALNGVIEYLVSGIQESKKILQEFYFLIVPILNPDGVYNGNNRMDGLGQNLNRFYHLPDLEKQPSCYAIKSIVQSTRRQLFAFFDFHGHANKKSCFLFGNSISNTRLQTESVLFAKYFSSICDYMEFKSCNFTKKQMSSKDKNEDFSKEGCARVVVHRWTNSPYCYTLETGLYKNVKVDEKGIERYGQKFYGPQIYMQVGAKMVVSLFAIQKKSKNMEEMKKSVGLYVAKLEKMNLKKQKERGKDNIKKEATMKDLNKEVKAPQLKKIKSEKENQYTKDDQYTKEEKFSELDQIFQKNKNYLLSLEADEDNDD